ncbi:MAG TPA: AAA family ATPase [Saprospiraceae bacterium]|nr:AAA family ATPase [Saprospiraceae bacterium]
MRINKLRLKNFRLFQDLVIDFGNSNITASIGINGAGKTSILDAISKALSSIMSDENLQTHGQDFLSNSDILKGETNTTIEASFSLDGKTINVNCNWSIDGNGQNTVDNTGEFIKNRLPLMVYYRVNRTSSIPVFAKSMISDRVSAMYSSALEANVSAFSKFEGWFINELNLENEYKVSKADHLYELDSLRNVRNAFKNFLSIVGENSITDIRIDRDAKSTDFNLDNEPYAVVIKNGDRLRFNQLSSGERMVMYLVSDIARRLTFSAQNDENTINGSGIVLIDELDLHLHPAWQKTIVQALKNTFPNVQFIVTTHAPLILSTLRPENILALSDGNVISKENLPKVYSGTADEVLEELMNVKPYMMDFDSEKQELDILYNNFQLDEAEKKLKQLKHRIDSNAEWIVNYEKRIAFAKT